MKIDIKEAVRMALADNINETQRMLINDMIDEIIELRETKHTTIIQSSPTLPEPAYYPKPDPWWHGDNMPTAKHV